MTHSVELNPSLSFEDIELGAEREKSIAAILLVLLCFMYWRSFWHSSSSLVVSDFVFGIYFYCFNFGVLFMFLLFFTFDACSEEAHRLFNYGRREPLTEKKEQINGTKRN